ncbi:MAG TPA: Spy/CpxP family protein refolding chaperone [Pyrinomonadaceae bacterium]|nr:Spy/CpxP family protein refolding chaperone [Pyrinomonadaceae bacterium]
MTITGRTRLKMWFVLVAVFVLGSVTGAALTGLYRSRASSDRPEAHEKAMHERFEKMRTELNLTDDQTKAVQAIIDETRNEYRALRTELRPRFEEPRQKARARIRVLLTPKQQQKFDAMVVQQDAQHDEQQKSRH